MNQNTILATLEVKGIINREEAEQLSNHIENRPQSTVLADAVQEVQTLLAPIPTPTTPIGPVGPEQANEETAARQATTSPLPPANETPTEFPTLPGANESTGNDLSIDEMSEAAKETNKTGNQDQVVDDAKSSDAAPASTDSADTSPTGSDNSSDDSTPQPRSEALKSAVKKPAKK